MTVKELLKENALRRERNGACFDPATGEGSTGKRFPYEFGGQKLWLPETMRDSPVLEHPDGKSLDAERVKHDFPYWAATRAYIKRKGGGEDVLFRLNRAQRKLVEALEEMRVAGEPIRLILLKARQWGGSTCIQIYMAWLQLVQCEGLNSLILAHQGSATDEIKDMFDRLIQGINDNRGEELHVENVGRSRSVFRVAERNAKVKLGTAERPDSCRGGDYSLVHCSEVGIWKATVGKTPEQIVRSACAGVLLKPMTMIVYESTANGTGNFFHREYEAACRGESQFRPLFVAWYEIDQYSEPLEDEEAFAEELLAGRDCESASSERRESGAALWRLWEKGATLEAINWYVKERAKYGSHDMMAAEYPSDDEEAFVHSGRRVFSRGQVDALREDCGLCCATGDIDGGFVTNPAGGWKVWRKPEVRPDGITYVDRYLVIADIGGRSEKSDWSVIAVIDRLGSSPDHPDEIVAQWRGHTDFDLLAEKVRLAACYYCGAKVVITVNPLEIGDPTRNVDGDHSSYIIGRLRDSCDLYIGRTAALDVRQGQSYRYGFTVNAATQTLIVDNLVRTVRGRLYTEHDAGCLDEMLDYEWRDNGTFGAIAGRHEDMLMTRAVGLYVSQCELEAPRPRNPAHFRRLRRNRGSLIW